MGYDGTANCVYHNLAHCTLSAKLHSSGITNIKSIVNKERDDIGDKVLISSNRHTFKMLGCVCKPIAEPIRHWPHVVGQLGECFK